MLRWLLAESQLSQVILRTPKTTTVLLKPLPDFSRHANNVMAVNGESVSAAPAICSRNASGHG